MSIISIISRNICLHFAWWLIWLLWALEHPRTLWEGGEDEVHEPDREAGAGSEHSQEKSDGRPGRTQGRHTAMGGNYIHVHRYVILWRLRRKCYQKNTCIIVIVLVQVIVKCKIYKNEKWFLCFQKQTQQLRQQLEGEIKNHESVKKILQETRQQLEGTKEQVTHQGNLCVDLC